MQTLPEFLSQNVTEPEVVEILARHHFRKKQSYPFEGACALPEKLLQFQCQLADALAASARVLDIKHLVALTADFLKMRAGEENDRGRASLAAFGEVE